MREQAVVNLSIEGREEYEQFSLGVMDKLCADVTLGLDFMKLHKGVQFMFHGDKSLFQLDSKVLPNRNDACLVMAANVDPTRIFRTIKEDCKPTVSLQTLYIPCYRTNKLQRCIKYQGIKIWNSIPQKIRVLSYNRLKIQYRNFLLNQ